MFHKQKSKLMIIFPLMIIGALLTSCAKTETSADSTGVGYVTETTLSNTVESSGSVAAYQVATLTWGTSGTVSEVKISTNDKVNNGEELMSLESASAPAEVVLAITELISAQQALDAAKSSNTALAEAEVALVEAQDAYYQALGYSYTLDKPVGSDDYNAILRADLIAAQEAVEDAEDYYNGFAEYADSDPLKANARAALAEARIAEKEATSIYNYYTNTPNTLDAAAINADLALAKATLDDAQRTYDLLKTGDNTDAITSAQAEVDAAQATVNKLKIISTFDGEAAVVYSQPGDVVSEGDEAAIIVNRDRLYVDVSIDETSIASVSIGNTAEISIDATGYSTTGKVTIINPIGTASNGVVNYTVRVELDKTDPSILLGSTASVVITTGEPQSVLFVPVQAVLSDSQGEYVMRINDDGSQERVSVVSSTIYDETVVVIGDLKAGDEVQTFASVTSSEEEEQAGAQGFGIGTMGGGEMPQGGGEMPQGGGQPPSGGSAPSMP